MYNDFMWASDLVKSKQSVEALMLLTLHNFVILGVQEIKNLKPAVCVQTFLTGWRWFSFGLRRLASSARDRVVIGFEALHTHTVDGHF